MKPGFLGAAALSAVLCTGHGALAAVFSEPPDASASFPSASELGTLDPGTHTISGSLSCATQLRDDFYNCAFGQDQADIFRFDIGAGTVLSGFELDISNFTRTNDSNDVSYQLLKGGAFTSNRVFAEFASDDIQTGNLLDANQGADFYFFDLLLRPDGQEQSSVSLDYTATLTVKGPKLDPIPLPASAVLLAGAIAGFGAIRRARK